jgi:cytochrome c55X
MKRRAGVLLALGLAAAWPVTCAQEAAPPASALAVEAGRKLYISSCQRCHGIDLATSSIGFDLRTFPHDDKERFRHSVTNGVRAMPAWGATLKPEQIDLLWTYIGAVNGWKAEPAPR